MFHNQAHPSKRWEQLDWADISMPLVWLGDRSSSSLSFSLSLHGVRWRILCDRGWNEMCGAPSPANLDRLCSFLLFCDNWWSKAHISLSWGIVAQTACLQMQMRSDLWEAATQNWSRGWLYKRWAEIFRMKMRARILYLIPESESGEARGLRVWSLAGIWQVVIKSGLPFGLLYLEQLSLPSTMTDAAISDSDDCQLLTRLCITPSSPLCLYLFLEVNH